MLLAEAEEREVEVLALGRGELTAVVHTAAQVVDDAVVAIYARASLDASHKLGVAILELTRARHHEHTLEVNVTLVPPLALLVELHDHRRGWTLLVAAL